MHTVNGISHFDVAGPDSDALAGFYSGVFGWGVVPRGPGYSQLETPDGAADGAIVEAEEASLTIGLVVADLEATVGRAEREGGAVVMPPTDNGFVVKAQVGDPAGNVLTLIQA